MAAENGNTHDVRRHWKCLVACFLITLSPFQYGIDFGLIGGFQAMIGFLQTFGHAAPQTPLGWNISPGRQQLISSLMTLGAFISSSAVGPIATFCGRKLSLWIAVVLCVAANLTMMLTTSINGLYAGRFVIGLANGMFMTFSQLYLLEVAPAHYRGLAIGFFQIWTASGVLIGTVVDNSTAKIHSRNSYLIPLGLIYIVPTILAVGLFFIPESPRWLVQQGRNEEAKKSLRWLRPSEEEAEQELREIEVALEKEMELGNGVAVWDMFANPIDRRRTIVSVLGLTTQAACGAMYVIAYGTYFFAMAGINKPFEMSCILTSISVVAIVVNSAIVTRWGYRRQMLMAGLVICGFTQLIMAAVHNTHPGTAATGRVVVAMSILYLLAYSTMIATYAYLSGGELSSQRLRSYTFGFATAIGFLGAWLATFTAPYFINPESLNWGPKYGYIWAPSCFVTAIWVFFYLPEVKDRTLEEIDEMFEARVPARKFRQYKCHGFATAIEDKSSQGSYDGHQVVERNSVSKNDAVDVKSELR